MIKRTIFLFMFFSSLFLISISGCSNYSELSKLDFNYILNLFFKDQPTTEQIAQKIMKESIEEKRQAIKKGLPPKATVYLEGETIKHKRAWMTVPKGWFAVIPDNDQESATIMLTAEQSIPMQITIDAFKPDEYGKSDASPDNICNRMLSMYSNESEKWSIIEPPYKMTGFGESVCYFNVYRKPTREFQYNVYIFMNSNTIYSILVSSLDGNFYPTLILNEAVYSCFSSELKRAFNFALKIAPELKEFKKIDYKAELFK